jgi:L-lactate dehydrogenase
MKRRVGIIGCGSVGASVAVSTLHSGAADELLLNDLRTQIAEGEAMDLAHGASFYPAASVRTAAIEDMCDTDAVVITAGRNGKAGESRLDLVRDNAKVMQEIGRRLKGCRGVIVLVTNPVDVLTQVMTQTTGLPTGRVIGTGTMLDTARLRQVVGRTIGVEARSVHTHVVGEHGDSQVALWSSARVGGAALRSRKNWDRSWEPRISTEVRTAAYEIIQRKGATNHAIGLVAAELLRCMLRSERRVLTVSRVQDGAVGIDGVALSLPSVVGAEGVLEVLEPEMSDEERASLQRSAEVLRTAFTQIEANG